MVMTRGLLVQPPYWAKVGRCTGNRTGVSTPLNYCQGNFGQGTEPKATGMRWSLMIYPTFAHMQLGFGPAPSKNIKDYQWHNGNRKAEMV